MRMMAQISSAAPLLGAALAAALMVAGTAAFQAGAGAGPSPAAEPFAAPAPLVVSEASTPDRVFDVRVIEAETTGPAPPKAAPAAPRPRLAVIIDDVADLETAQRLWSFDAPITLAVLPYAEAAPQIARRAMGGKSSYTCPWSRWGWKIQGRMR
jgi:hypothetical protein